MSLKVLVEKKDIKKIKEDAILVPLNPDFSVKKYFLKLIGKDFLKNIDKKENKVFVMRNPRDFLNYKYIICACMQDTLNIKDTEEDFRKVIYEVLEKADKFKINSLVIPLIKVLPLSPQAVAKIMAQEVFRYMRKEKKNLKKITFALDKERIYQIFKKNISGYINYISKKITQGPFLTVDGIVRYKGGIVMVERKNPPFGWALPGGFVDYAESAESAVVREIKEETNLDFVDFRQFKVYSQPQRDPRFHTVSVVFAGKGKGTLKASSDAKNVKIFKPNRLPQIIAFDHRRIIQDYLMSKKDDKD